MTNIIADKTLVYQVPEQINLIWSEWEDASIVYDQRSGHTQVLNEFARELFELLEDSPKNIDQLYKGFEEIVERPLDEVSKNNIIETILGFDTMGLIEPV